MKTKLTVTEVARMITVPSVHPMVDIKIMGEPVLYPSPSVSPCHANTTRGMTKVGSE